MRSVLYVIAALMIGASIYGFIDYSRTNNSKEFAAMYDEKETTGPVITENGKPAEDPIPVNKKEQVATVNAGKVKNEK